MTRRLATGVVALGVAGALGAAMLARAPRSHRAPPPDEPRPPPVRLDLPPPPDLSDGAPVEHLVEIAVYSPTDPQLWTPSACAAIDRPDVDQLAAAVFPLGLATLDELAVPPPPAWLRDAATTLGMRPRDVGMWLADRAPWAAWVAVRTESAWYQADSLDQYRAAGDDPKAWQTWWDTPFPQGDAELEQLLTESADPDAQLYAVARAFETLRISDAEARALVVSAPTPEVRRLAAARTCGMVAWSPSELDALDQVIEGAPQDLALAALAFARRKDLPSFERFADLAAACRAGGGRRCPTPGDLRVFRAVLGERYPAETWAEALDAAAYACAQLLGEELVEASGAWDDGWRFAGDPPFLACVAAHHVSPAPPDRTRIRLRAADHPAKLRSVAP